MSALGTKLSRVLVANRGEIAVRIMRTLDRLGMSSVAVFHRAERAAQHVVAADHAVELRGATPVAAHLDIDQIIAAAKASGADAIHPGYGFLSENAAFARTVKSAGLTFVGPDPDTIELMGDKIHSRAFAEKNGVPVAPSVLPTGDIDTFIAEAGKIGFPLLVKAAAGGGGKGMSIVHRPEDLAEKARLAASEAERYFSDNRIYAELFVERPRHIEVQVFGDGHGGAVHMFERECSIQRRFQKIVEEAPAPQLDDALRDEICGSAVRLAKAARYANAGTVEFILAPDGCFYFLEMNTRLQVEHPVTEAITGRDLVELQLAIAGGGNLPAQAEITTAGHAIECRICAEDPEQDFLPETGELLRFQPPVGEGVRFDSGLTEGQTVSADFDPMLAKLITCGDTRDAAADRMQSALHETLLLGVTTNIDYLGRIMANDAFRRGNLDTSFVEQYADDLAEPPLSDLQRRIALAAAALSAPAIRTLLFDTPEPYASMNGWRNG